MMKAERYFEIFGPDYPVKHYVPEEWNSYLRILRGRADKS